MNSDVVRSRLPLRPSSFRSLDDEHDDAYDDDDDGDHDLHPMPSLHSARRFDFDRQRPTVDALHRNGTLSRQSHQGQSNQFNVNSDGVVDHISFFTPDAARDSRRFEMEQPSTTAYSGDDSFGSNDLNASAASSSSSSRLTRSAGEDRRSRVVHDAHHAAPNNAVDAMNEIRRTMNVVDEGEVGNAGKELFHLNLTVCTLFYT